MKIGILKKRNFDAVSYYRLLPWFILGKQTDVDVISIDIKRDNEYEISSLDFFVCHSPATKLEARVIAAAKELGVKVIMDYDDLVFEVSDINPASQFWSEENNQINAIELLFQADAITVSTEALKEEFKKRFDIDAFLIRNGFNNAALEMWPDPPKNKRNNPLIMWRGSNTHEGDLYTHREAFHELRNAEYLFFGYKPAKFSKQYGGPLNSVPYQKGNPWILGYFQMLLKIRPTFIVVPLEDTLFNRCKSNIAALEGLWCGAVPIAPAYMPEFKDIPCVHYDDPNDLREIFDCIDDGEDYSAILQRGRNDIQMRYMVEHINYKRVDILNVLTGAASPADAREGGVTL